MSKVLKDMHDLAVDLHEVGAMDSTTMKAMDELCLSKSGDMNREMEEAVKGIVSGDKDSLGKALSVAKEREAYLSARRFTSTEE